MLTNTWNAFLLNKKILILLSQVYCVWQVVKTPTVISNNPVLNGIHNKTQLDKYIEMHGQQNI